MSVGEKKVERARRRITLYFKSELLEEARSAVLTLGAQGQEPSNLSRLFEAALAGEIARLRDMHNDGASFGRYRARLPGGRPRNAETHNDTARELRKAITRDRWKIIDELILKDGKVCGLCRRLLTQIHLDHIVPISRGGTNELSNLRLLCPRCNSTKGAKMDQNLDD